MPQLLPFSYISSVTTILIVLSFTIWTLSVLILPLFPRVQIARMLITKL